MEKQALKDIMYGSLSEMIENSKYYNVWAVQKSFTPEGEKSLIEFFNMISRIMVRIDREDLDRRSKEIVMNSLKGEKE